MDSQVEVGVWDHDHIYNSLEDCRIEQEIEGINQVIEKLRPFGDLLQLQLESELVEDNELLKILWESARLIKQTSIPMSNLQALVLAETSVDSQNKLARNLYLELQKLSVRLIKSCNPFTICMDRISDIFLQRFLEPTEFKDKEFLLRISRNFRPFQLPLEQENLLSSMAPAGLRTWQSLYEDLSSKVPVELDGKSTSLAQAMGLLENPEASKRRLAYLSLDNNYHTHRHSYARILTSQVRWRLSEQKQRSSNRSMHFLDEPLQMGRLTRDSLDAMNLSVEKFRPKLQAILTRMAQYFEKDRLDPWDLLAQAPLDDSLEFSYEEAMQLIEEAYRQIDPEMGDFVRIMVEKRWIDVRKGDSRRPSAFAFHFQDPMEPRVFGTYMGTMKSLRMLAHEVGHAYHFWCLRDQPQEHQRYPLTLAETASIFGELSLGKYLEKHPSEAVRRLSAWQDGQSVLTYMLNIPMRFDFERQLYERGEEHLEAEDLCALMSEVCMDWYGEDGLSQPMKYFWASKLHFNLAYFYNYPYTFGYLLAQVLFDEYLREPQGFHSRYTRFLRGTGKLNCEDLIRIELEENCEKLSFWERGAKMAEGRAQHFMNLFD